jgi:hypothetical protein
MLAGQPVALTGRTTHHHSPANAGRIFGPRHAGRPTPPQNTSSIMARKIDRGPPRHISNEVNRSLSPFE